MQLQGCSRTWIDAIGLRTEADAALLRDMGVRLSRSSIPIAQTFETMQAGLLGLRNAKITVQGRCKRQVLPAAVMHSQFHTQRAGPELNREHCLKGVQPDGARFFAVRQAQGDLHTILAQWPRSIGLPVTEARKAMLDQGTTLVELGKADRNAAANGALAVMGCAGTEKQAFLPLADPGQHLGALQADQRRIPLTQLQSNGRKPFPVNGLGLKRQITHP